jgi:hypothetical protein
MLMFDNGLFASFIPQIIMVVAYISCFIAPTNKNQQDYINTSDKIIVVTNFDSSDSNKTDNNCIDFYPNFQGIKNNASIQFFRRVIVVEIAQNQLFQLSDKTIRFHFSRPPPTFS